MYLVRRAAPLLLTALLIAGSFQLGRALPPESAGAAEWTTVGDLVRPRAYAEAITLSTGEILVVGGLDNDDPEVVSHRSELVDPATGRITVLPDLLLGRLNHSVTTGWGGRVAVIGGTEFRRGPKNTTYWAPVDRVEVFIPESRTWMVGAPLVEERSDHSATALRDGRILVAGGNQGGKLLRSVEIYDPSRDLWTIAAPLPRPRTQFSMTTLLNGRVLVAGGFQDDGIITASTLLYDPVTNRWTGGATLLEPRLNHAMVPLPGGDVLFVGGEGHASATSERYDYRLGRFVDAGRISAPRLVAQAAHLPDGRVLLAGGLPVPGVGSFAPVAAVELWDPATSVWATVPDAPTRRAFGLLVSTDRGVYRVSGSEGDERAARTVERFWSR